MFSAFCDALHRQPLRLTPKIRHYAATLPNRGPLTSTAPSHNTAPLAARYPYHVYRNSNDALPVYTDIRNTKYLVLIRNIQGNIDTLVQDLRTTLFPPESEEAQRLKVETRSNRHILLSGGRLRKSQVMDWLREKGF